MRIPGIHATRLLLHTGPRIRMGQIRVGGRMTLWVIGLIFEVCSPVAVVGLVAGCVAMACTSTTTSLI